MPRKLRLRRSSALMAADPYTLVVALDASGAASGELYMDDEKSYNYRDAGAFIRRRFSFAGVAVVV